MKTPWADPGRSGRDDARGARRTRSARDQGAVVEGEEVTDREAIRRLIQQKLQDGRLPHQNAARARGSPGDGAICDACGQIITANQVMMEVGSFPGEQPSLCFHSDYFQLWNAEWHTKPM
jgi:hypothetical protein